MKPQNNQGRRSPLSHALGLGSAKAGVEQWWRERVSKPLALVPLTVWFAASIIMHTNSDYVTLIAWLRTPIVSLLMVLLLAGIFYHAALGLQVVIEDYVHSALKTLALLGNALWLPLRIGCRRDLGDYADRFEPMRDVGNSL